ncbi:MAG: nodulation protein NfeD [Dehalococcoidia bacterium]
MHRLTRPRRLAAAIALLLAGLALACSTSTEPGAIHILRIDGGIGPITERFIDRGFERAEDNEARLVVIEMDTPGGLSTSMRKIVQRIEASSVPTVVYVTPKGARAASAGTFITMAAHVAVMAPNTSIGAAAAIDASGGDIEGTLGKKIEEDAVAFIRGIAELRDRNADWAEQAVREAVAASATDAVELNVVDFIANDLAEIIERIDGTTIQLNPVTTVQLEGLATAPHVRTEMTVWERFLDILADPNLATILISIGFLALIFELSNPGIIFPGVVGVILMILGFIGLGVLDVEIAGIALIAVALVFFALELFVPSGGVLAAGGLVALILGGIIAFRNTPTELQPNRILLAILALIVGTMFVSLAIGITRMRKLTAVTGSEALIGALAVARTPLTPEGMIFVQGERWKAELDQGTAQPGDYVRIIGADGFKLRVRKEENSS